jgi:hypothetical protein
MPYDAITADDIFQCRKCGDCCRGYGGTYLTDQDIIAIAGFLNIPPRGFLEAYCVYSGSRPILAQREDGYCVFWDQLCRIHPVKPRMCKAWPFIESVLADFGNWEIMSAFCPGIRTEHPPEAIQTCIKKQLEKTGDRHF